MCRIVLHVLHAAMTVALFAAPTSAQVNGAIYTTFPDGATVNGNIYPSKDAVYLSGGPQNEHRRGLQPDGLYYFQVTDPSGAVLLSTDDISCRVVVVSDGAIVGVPAGAAPPTCTSHGESYHAFSPVNHANGSTPVQLMPFHDTPNPGGEYKAWITPVEAYDGVACQSSHGSHGFCDNASKTDNFKTRIPTAATISVCKFNDANANGVRDNDEPLIPHWPITASGVDGGLVSAQTDDRGCVSFAYSGYTASHATQAVTLTEGRVGPDWTQTAPVACGNVANCQVQHGSIVLTVAAGESVAAPDFGNTNPLCGAGCSPDSLIATVSANPSLTRTFTWNIAKHVDRTRVETAGPRATFNYSVDVGHDAGLDSGWRVDGTVQVSNPGSSALTDVTVTVATNNGASACTVEGGPHGDGTSVAIAAGSHVDLPYTCTYHSQPGAGIAVATASPAPTSGVNAVSGSAGIDFSSAVIAVVDGHVDVTDSLGGHLGTVSSNDASPASFAYAYEVAGTPGTCVAQDNVATFTSIDTGATGSSSRSVTLCTGSDLLVDAGGGPSFSRTYTWNVSKNVDKTEVTTSSGGSATFNYAVDVAHDSGIDSAWRTSGTITAQNPNDWEPVTVNVTASVNNGGICTVTGGAGAVIPANGSLALPYSCAYEAAPSPSAGLVTAMVTWDASAAFTSAAAAPGTAGAAFDSVTPSIVNGSVIVTDTLQGSLGVVSYTDASPKTFSYPKTVTAPAGTCSVIPNTASLSSGQSSSQSVKVCGASALVVANTSSATFNPSIKKTVDKTRVEQAGGSATFNYTVNVTTGGWLVSGTITVSNPNDWEAITVTAGDALSIGSSCVVTGSPATIAAGATLTLPYTCSFSAAPAAAAGTSTASVAWDAASAHTAAGSGASSSAFSFSPMAVIDTFNGVPTPLGTITGNSGSTTYTYARTVANGPGGSCRSYTNTAAITGGPSSSQTVNICNTTTGALTIGFWQNKNGQGIVTSGAAAGGVCVSGSWLRQFAPFQDLSPTANCSAAGTYVTNVIKAASAKGAAMNAMLKAQMLAAALDVFFSSSALGGNRINAPGAIGSARIDLTAVCPMIDGSTGIGACSGTPRSVALAFGGSTSLTVSQMLAYAAGQSTAGGNIWYANVKATQGLAKDAFDAVNNQVALLAP